MGKGNLILIGMPGCGKSSAGVVLAKALGLDFLDTDLLIQRRSGQRLCEILRARGDAAFRRLEEETLCQVDCADTVIATGGSTAGHDVIDDVLLHVVALGTCRAANSAGFGVEHGKLEVAVTHSTPTPVDVEVVAIFIAIADK